MVVVRGSRVLHMNEPQAQPAGRRSDVHTERNVFSTRAAVSRPGRSGDTRSSRARSGAAI